MPCPLIAASSHIGFDVACRAPCVDPCQAVEKVFFLSLRAKRDNLAFNKINGLEIASSQKLLLAMTYDEFFNTLLSSDISAAVFSCCAACEWR